MVAQNFGSVGFTHQSTMHSFLSKRLTSSDVVIMDEFAAAGTEIQAKVLDKIQRAGAKAIIIGDDKQFPSVAYGGMFPFLV